MLSLATHRLLTRPRTELVLARLRGHVCTAELVWLQVRVTRLTLAARPLSREASFDSSRSLMPLMRRFLATSAELRGTPWPTSVAAANVLVLAPAQPATQHHTAVSLSVAGKRVSWRLCGRGGQCSSAERGLCRHPSQVPGPRLTHCAPGDTHCDRAKALLV